MIKRSSESDSGIKWQEEGKTTVPRKPGGGDFASLSQMMVRRKRRDQKGGGRSRGESLAIAVFSVLCMPVIVRACWRRVTNVLHSSLLFPHTSFYAPELFSPLSLLASTPFPFSFPPPQYSQSLLCSLVVGTESGKKKAISNHDCAMNI